MSETNIQPATASAVASSGLLARVTWDECWNRLPVETRRHLSAHDGVQIRNMVKQWVRETYSDAMGVANDECPTNPTDNFLWGYRSACLRIIDHLMERANAGTQRREQAASESRPVNQP